MSKEIDNQKVTNNDCYTLLSAGDLNLHDSFQLRKNGKYYTVHDKVLTNDSELPNYPKGFYIIAVCGSKNIVVDYEREVLACT